MALIRGKEVSASDDTVSHCAFKPLWQSTENAEIKGWEVPNING